MTPGRFLKEKDVRGNIVISSLLVLTLLGCVVGPNYCYLKKSIYGYEVLYENQ